MKKMPLEKFAISKNVVTLTFNDGRDVLVYGSKDEPTKDAQVIFDSFIDHFNDMTGLRVSEERADVTFVKCVVDKQGDSKYMIGIAHSTNNGVHAINSPLVHQDDCKKGMAEHFEVLQSEAYKYMAGNRKQADLFAGEPDEVEQNDATPGDVDF